jgi:hypothetical protein
MARDGRKALTQDLAQRETDHQRWADDGGRSPDAQPNTPKTDLPVTMPVRLVYHRRDRRFPRALLFASTATPSPVR